MEEILGRPIWSGIRYGRPRSIWRFKPGETVEELIYKAKALACKQGKALAVRRTEPKEVLVVVEG